MQQVIDNKKLMVAKMSFVILALFMVLSSSFNVDANELKTEMDKSSLPASFYRFLLYTSKPNNMMERQANLMGYKRSSGALDALTGVTLGKRSDFALNLDPYFGRHYSVRQSPRFYDFRWAPSDLYEVAAESS